ncbi:[protein-PII] uridylyltransferase [Thermodesulfatator autotrophicus]|uniref:Bifunctional uridylyltransferase/uridylyl-removing enzyme n=1 Tax=Thermodesulfatator autotrophicus TaxID=1795632 RepID=A0A177E5M7_9BACT|nr:[protein-PII] uridylyltransferase [Thermodesulfatator autotrophicus]OAG27078.1 hypothetical protein TH606_08775 [Thermodesulfatator autotrophicus]
MLQPVKITEPLLVARSSVVNRAKRIDGLIKGLFPSSFKRKPVAILGVGGYGRKELCPYSDIDLLFLHGDLSEEKISQLVEKVLYTLWDQKFEVGYRVCSLEEVFADARKDFSLLTALLDARLISGSKKLYQKFKSLFNDSLIAGRRKELFLALKSTRLKRLEIYSENSFLLEPNLKEGLGGLRDFHLLLWTARILFGLETLRDIERAGLISSKEKKLLKSAYQFLLAVREELHFQARRHEDRLYFEYQPIIAVKMGFGYETEGAISKFMTNVYRAMSQIHEIVEAVLDHVELTLGFLPDERKKLEGGFEIISGRLYLTYRERALWDLSYVLNLFMLQAETGLKLHHLTRIFLKENFSSSKSFNLVNLEGRFFTKLLTKPYAYLALKSMRETGFLTKILPEFQRIIGLTQFDVYHIHPLDEHLLLTIKELGALREERSDYWERIENEEVLFLAGLLHDLTKGLPGRHAETGAQMALEIAFRLGFSEKEAQMVSRLVKDHLLMVETAFRRDLTEEKVVIDFARKMKNLGHLTRLYFLTIADSRATGPAAWSSWKAALIDELYLKTAKIFSEGVLAQKQTIIEIEEKEKALRKEFGSLVDILPSCYLLYSSLENLKPQLSLLKIYKEKNLPFLFNVSKQRDLFRVFIITKDKPGLFVRLTGVFTLHHLDIKQARIFTLEDGTALDIFEVSSPYGDFPKEELENSFLNFVLKDENIENSLKEIKPLFCSIRKPSKKLDFHVSINNEHSDFFTIIEIYAPDKLGLLYHLAKSLSKWPLNIERAFISNKEDLASDVFYVRSIEGEKLANEECEKLQKYLVNTLKEFFKKNVC